MEQTDLQVPKALQQANPDLAIHSLDDQAFASFGRILPHVDARHLVQLADANSDIPSDANRYLPELACLQESGMADVLSRCFGDMPIQIGICNGPNGKLNAMEYHKSPELFIAVTDCLQFLTPYSALKDFTTADSARTQAFYFPKGIVALIDPLVLHFAPCAAKAPGFKSIIVLPKGTNLPLPKREATGDPEQQLLFATNKWLIVHPEDRKTAQNGAKVGIIGKNLEINPA